MNAEHLPGCIGFSGPRTGGSLFQKLIKFFTGSKWSHSFIVTLPFAGEDAVQEAVMAVQVVPLSRYRDDPNCAYEIYRVAVSAEAIPVALEYCFNEYAGIKYGYLQLPWFAWRWINEKIGRDIRKENNWLTDGVICSELVYDYLKQLSPYTFELLSGFNPDIIQSEDIYRIVKAHPEAFQLIEEQ
jgi:hypothetical protein